MHKGGGYSAVVAPPTVYASIYFCVCIHRCVLTEWGESRERFTSIQPPSVNTQREREKKGQEE